MHKLTNSASAIIIASLFSSLALAGDSSPAPQPALPHTLSPASIHLGTGFISITRTNVTTQKRDGQWTADVTCHITLNGVPNIPFIFNAALVDENGKVHTDKRGTPYSASREVSTGDSEDTDKYTVTIPLAGLFTSRAALFVRAQILDSSNKVIASSMPEPFTPPKD